MFSFSDLIEDYSYWYVNGSEPTFSQMQDPEGKYGILLKIKSQT